MRYEQAHLQDQLAAEYVLGTLHGRARERFEVLMLQHPALQRRVDEWARRINPLGQGLAPIPPHPHNWARIEANLNAEAAPRKTAIRLRNYWGMLAASIVLVIGLFVGLNVTQPAKSYVVVIADPHSQPMWVVRTSARQDGHFDVKTMKPSGMGPDWTCVLWLQWQDGFTQAVGVLSEEHGYHADFKLKQLKRDPMKAQVLVSVERPGRDYTAPAAKIMFRGNWIEL